MNELINKDNKWIDVYKRQRFRFGMLDFRTVTVAEESGTFFIGSQCLCIFTHTGMNHCHFQGGYFLGTDFCFAYLRGDVVVDIKVVEHLFIDTVDTVSYTHLWDMTPRPGIGGKFLSRTCAGCIPSCVCPASTYASVSLATIFLSATPTRQFSAWKARRRQMCIRDRGYGQSSVEVSSEGCPPSEENPQYPILDRCV